MSRLSFSLRLPVRVTTTSQALTNESIILRLTNQRSLLPNADQRRGEGQEHGLVDVELVLEGVDLEMTLDLSNFLKIL